MSAEKKLAPGPRPAIPLKNFLDFRKDPLAFMTNVARTYGDVAHFRMGRNNFFFVNHPDHIKDLLVTSNRKFRKSLVLQRAKKVLGEGLLTSEGEFHMRQRRLAQPAFHRQRVANYAETMVRYADRASERWKDGESRDIHEEMMRLTLAIAGKTLFDADVEGDAKEIGKSLEVFMKMFGFMVMPFSDLLEKFPLPSVRRLNAARKQMDDVVFRLIAERRKSGRDHGDLLSMLLRAQDEDDGGVMTDQQLRDECLTILLAGHETTANALTFSWMLLAQHPEAAARMHAEVDALGARPLTIEDLPKLKYTESVFAEAMRLYPPAWAMGRQALEDHEMGGFHIPRMSMILCSQWVMHRDTRFHERPTEFTPERWTTETSKTRPKFSYFPFGGGPRQCIGEAFAWMEGVLVLAAIAQKWKFQLPAHFKVALQPAITLRPKGGMKMKVVAR